MPRGNPNIKPRWKPGESGNPAGRKTAGASIKEWWNSMVAWSLDEVRDAANNERKPVAQRIAAKQILQAVRGRGSGEAVDRIVHSTDAKPVQRQEIIHDGSIRATTEGESAAAALLAKLTERLGTAPASDDL